MSTVAERKLTDAETTLADQIAAAGDTDGATRFRASGLPTRRNESYHYTDLRQLLRDVPAVANEAGAAPAPAIRLPGAYRLVTANGALQEHGVAPAGIVVGKTKGSPLTIGDDVLVRLNAALATECVTVDLSLSVDPVVHLDHLRTGDAAHHASATRIFVADGGSATVVETFSGSAEAHVTNHGSYVQVGDGATLTHILVDLSPEPVRHFATTEYLIAANSNVRTVTIHAGAALCRTAVNARFAGEGSHGDFTGLNLVDDGQHRDITLFVEHAVPNTTSAELYKQVARGRGRAVFQGKIVVAQDAQKTDAKMMMQGLMLSEQAEIFSKPELEIFADDVACGHGSTCGDLEEDHLFYLMSRGIPANEARAMLVRAFLSELFDPLADDELREALTAIADEWLVRG